MASIPVLKRVFVLSAKRIFIELKGKEVLMMTKLKLMPDELNNSINELLGSLFSANAVADNIVYQLENVYAMPKASDLFHHKYAHAFPAIADTVNKIQILRGARGTRKPVAGSEMQFASVISCFENMLSAVLEVEKKFCDTLDLCDELDEKAIRIFIENTYMDILPYTKQTLVWLDKAEQFGDDLTMFDALFDTTIILEGI
jgi:hypothetical protein